MNVVRIIHEFPWGARTPDDLRVMADAVAIGLVLLSPQKQAEVIRLLADRSEHLQAEVRA